MNRIKEIRPRLSWSDVRKLIFHIIMFLAAAFFLLMAYVRLMTAIDYYRQYELAEIIRSIVWAGISIVAALTLLIFEIVMVVRAAKAIHAICTKKGERPPKD